MRYKAIAAALGAASLLAMGITAAAESAKSSYSIDGAATTVTEGPGPNHDDQRVVCAGRQGDTSLRIHESVLVLMGFGGGCARRHRAMAI